MISPDIGAGSLEEKANNSERPVDLVHLARYTLGNRSLEHEVLELFLRQSTLYLQKLKEADSQEAWRNAAHTIKGSAKGIGAWQVAGKAEALEKIENDKSSAQMTAVDSLENSIKDAKSFIEVLLEDK